MPIDGELLAEKLNLYLRERYKYKRPLVRLQWSERIFVNRAAVELYLHCRRRYPFPDDCLVIVSIEFRDQRRGNGRSLLEFLVDVADETGICSVGVESVGTEEMRCFVEKFGFTDIYGVGSEALRLVDERFRFACIGRHWIVSVDDLKRSLVQLSDSGTCH